MQGAEAAGRSQLASSCRAIAADRRRRSRRTSRSARRRQGHRRRATLREYASSPTRCRAGTSSRRRSTNISRADNAELPASPDGRSRRRVNEFVHPDVAASEGGERVALGAQAEAEDAGPRRRRSRVSVLNGNGVAGSAANAAYLLAQRGYQIVLPGRTARRTRRPGTTSTRRSTTTRAQQGSKAAAQALAKLFAPADVQPLPGPSSGQRSTRAPMHASSSARPSTATLAPGAGRQDAEAPARRTCVTHPDSTAAASSTSVRKRVPFQLEVPTVLEALVDPTSRRAGARVYRIDEGPQGGPARLRDRRRRVLGHRGDATGTTRRSSPTASFSDTHQGPRLRPLLHGLAPAHGRAARERRRSYWVVNTLLDSLSNETMLAIAKGLKPLGTAS